MQSLYSQNAGSYTALYEKISPGQVYAKWAHLLPPPQSRVLDVGAGSGRDAAWLESKGYEVTAVEPSEAMREKARERHPFSSVRWIGDTLPLLKKVRALNEKFSFILVNAVWIHIPPLEQDRAMGSLAALLSPNGILTITLRHGPSPDERIMHPCSEAALKAMAESQGLEILLTASLPDVLGRQEVSWTHMVFFQSN